MPKQHQPLSFVHEVRRLMVGWLMMFAAACTSTDNQQGAPQPPASHSTSPTQGAAAPLHVGVVEAKLVSLDTTHTRSGIARARQSATVAAEIPGRVSARPVHVGDQVKQGAVLARIDASAIALDVAHAKAAVDARTSDLRFAEAELDRTRQLFDADALADQHLDRAEHEAQRARDGLRLARATAAKAADAYRRATVRAPFAGIVVACHLDPGDYANPGKPVVTIADLSEIVVVVGLTSADAVRVEPGASLRVFFDSLGGLHVDAVVRGRAPAPDPTTGTYAAELVAPNPGTRILDGTLARVRIPVPDRKALLVPKSALTRFEGSPAVFVVSERDGSQHAFRRTVRLGEETDDRVEVLEGVEPGQRVVVDGAFTLRDGMPVLFGGDSLAVAE